MEVIAMAIKTRTQIRKIESSQTSPKPDTARSSAAAIKNSGIKEGVGFIAGDIFAYLYKSGEASLNDLKTELNQTPAMLQMAVGWLAREDKVQITKKGAGFLIRLNR
jgi:hypothetical protein